MNAAAASAAKDDVLAHPLIFRVEGVAPSKESYRKKGGRARDREWIRIKAFEELIGWRCRQAARPGQLARMFGRKLQVEVLLYHQRIDLDNVKLLIDSMKNIVYPDDSQRYVRRLEVLVGDDDGDPPSFEGPCIVMRVAVWE